MFFTGDKVNAKKDQKISFPYFFCWAIYFSIKIPERLYLEMILLRDLPYSMCWNASFCSPEKFM